MRPDRLIPTLLLLLAVTSGALARGRPDPRPEPLEASLATRYDEAGRPVVTVAVSRPHHRLVFTRDAGGELACELRVTVIAKRDGRQVGGGIRSVRTVVSDFEATRSETPVTCAVPVALPDDARVELEVHAEVVGTSRWWRAVIRYAPGGGGTIPWYFTDFDWNLPGGSSPDLERRMESLDLDLVLGVRPGPRDGERPVRLTVALRDAQGSEMVLSRRDLPYPAVVDTLALHVAMPTRDFPFGRLALSVYLEDDEDGRLDLSPEREFVNYGLPFRDDATWRRHITWLEGVVPERGERRALEALPADRRAEAWRSLWDARGPDAEPSEAQHLARIVEADRRYARFGRGALSDRGLTFVHRGPPDHIDTIGPQASSSGEWEVWYYRSEGVKVVFYDAYGLGDYRHYAELPY